MTNSVSFNTTVQRLDSADSASMTPPQSPTGHFDATSLQHGQQQGQQQHHRDHDHDQPQPQQLPQQLGSPSNSSVTVYQTTGPDGHSDPIVSSGSSGSIALNPRSCVTCRRRKVRCDKQMPCSNCRRALIPCVFPAPGRAPRRQRPRDPNAPQNNSIQREVELVKRLRKLEDIVEELSGQIEVEPGGRLPSATVSPDLEPPKFAASDGQPPSCTASTGLEILVGTGGPCSKGNDAVIDHAGEKAKRKEVQMTLGRLVLDDQRGTSRYVSSGFWSRLNDEVSYR